MTAQRAMEKKLDEVNALLARLNDRISDVKESFATGGDWSHVAELERIRHDLGVAVGDDEEPSPMRIPAHLRKHMGTL